MKKSRDTDKKRSKSDGGESRDDDMKKMREKWKRQQARKEGGEADFTWIKFKRGRNKIRILPRPGTGQFYLEAPKHFRVGPDQVGVRCIDPSAVDEKNGRPKPTTKCPVCKEFIRKQRAINAKYERGSEKGTKLWSKAFKKYAPSGTCLMNVLDEAGTVLKLSAGPMIMEQLLSYFFDDEGEVGDFTAVDTGRWISVKKIGEGRRTKYACRVLEGVDDISDRWDELQEQLHDLEEAAGEILSAEDVKAIMEGDGEGAAADTGSDDDDEDDAEESADRESDGGDDDDGYPDDDDSGDDDSDEDASDDDDDDDGDDDEGSHRSRRSSRRR
jgi:hypothetical protein